MDKRYRELIELKKEPGLYKQVLKELRQRRRRKLSLLERAIDSGLLLLERAVRRLVTAVLR